MIEGIEAISFLFARWAPGRSGFEECELNAEAQRGRAATKGWGCAWPGVVFFNAETQRGGAATKGWGCAWPGVVFFNAETQRTQRKRREDKNTIGESRVYAPRDKWGAEEAESAEKHNAAAVGPEICAGRQTSWG